MLSEPRYTYRCALQRSSDRPALSLIRRGILTCLRDVAVHMLFSVVRELAGESEERVNDFGSYP